MITTSFKNTEYHKSFICFKQGVMYSHKIRVKYYIHQLVWPKLFGYPRLGCPTCPPSHPAMGSRKMVTILLPNIVVRWPGFFTRW